MPAVEKIDVKTVLMIAGILLTIVGGAIPMLANQARNEEAIEAMSSQIAKHELALERHVRVSSERIAYIERERQKDHDTLLGLVPRISFIVDALNELKREKDTRRDP